MNEPVLFAIQIDCESTQRSINNPALGERAIRGLGEIFAQTDTKGTFFVIPGDIEAHGAVYRELEGAGHEIGLHIHASDQGGGEFLGDQSPDVQRRLIGEAIERFAQKMGRKPLSFCPGYFSANDFTFGILEEFGFTHGTVSCPTRDLPQCACVWGASPLDPHYAHRYNRVLAGNVDFVELPVTLDPDSRMWGGAQPLDLRVELVDAKNHWYTIDKSVKRQNAEQTPVKQIHAMTHNVFEFSETNDFRRQTCVGIIQAARQIAEQAGRAFTAVTLARIAAAYRQAVPLATAPQAKLGLDTRGRAFARM